MTRKKLPKKERPKGLYLYCNGCGNHYAYDALVTCKCDKLVYKSRIHIPGTKNKIRAKILAASNFLEAFNEFKKYQEELRANSYQKIQIVKKENIPVLLIECFAHYMGYLNNVDVPAHKQKERTEKYIKKFEMDFGIYLDALQKRNIDIGILKFTEVNDEMVGFIHEYLLNEKKYANKTYNNAMDNYRTFTSFIIRKFQYNYQNPFLGVEKRIVEPKIVTLEEGSFYSLLESLTHDNGNYEVMVKGKVRKYNCYRPWLKEGFLLGLFTGGRSEEIQQLKWSGITLLPDGNFKDLEVTHFKKNKRVSHLTSENDKIMKKFTITKELGDLLLAMGYNEKKGTNEFILAPDKSNRIQLGRELSLGFSHFYKRINGNREMKFKYLRKTYATSSVMQYGASAVALTEHSDLNILIKHYFGKESVKKKARKDWGVFKGLSDNGEQSHK